MYKAHKVRLEPTNKQATGLSRAAGTARFAYNWALARWGEQYDAFKKGERDAQPNALALRRELNALKREEFPWMMESTKCAPQEAIINLGKAFDNFFKRNLAVSSTVSACGEFLSSAPSQDVPVLAQDTLVKQEPDSEVA